MAKIWRVSKIAILLQCTIKVVHYDTGLLTI